MKRLEFISIIPSLGALPFLSKEIVKEDNKIILLEPKQIEILKEIPDCYIEPDEIQILMVHKGNVIGSASSRTIGISNGWMESMSLSMLMRRPPRLEIKATFDHDKVVEAFLTYQNS